MDSYGRHYRTVPHQAGYSDGPEVAHRQLATDTNYAGSWPSGGQYRYCWSTGDAPNFQAPVGEQRRFGVYGPSFNDVARDATCVIQRRDHTGVPSNCVLEGYCRRATWQSSSGSNYTSSQTDRCSPHATFPDVRSFGTDVDGRSAGAAYTACSSLENGGNDWSDYMSRAVVREARAKYRGTVPLNQLRRFDVEDRPTTVLATNRDWIPRQAIGAGAASTAGALSLPTTSSTTTRPKPDPKYACDHCDRRFVGRSDLERHLVVHTGVKAFVCPICDGRFSLKHNLARHLRKIHGQDSTKRGDRSTERVPHTSGEPIMLADFHSSVPIVR